MKIKLLGTGTSQGVPIIGCRCPVCISKDSKDKRLRSSAYIIVENKHIIIDAGPDFRQQMLRENILQIDAILLTHSHKDHIGGLDDIRAYNYLQGKPMDIYGSEETIDAVKKDLHYAFGEKKYPGVPKMNLHTIDNTPFFVENIKITPIELSHFKMKVFGFRIKNFAYITDASYISEAEKEKIKNLNTLILNALRIEKHCSHFCLEEALQIAQESQAKQCFFTHISHSIGKHKEINAQLPKHIQLGFDGQEIMD
ncbi:MAG: MBL fold metallo-hydrolase [Bacteroidales bacterium]|nr:MBL fold metallo-hydrolase [Bacteroidales bacterium]